MSPANWFVVVVLVGGLVLLADHGVQTVRRWWSR